MDAESGNRPKKTLANLGQHAKAAPSTPPDDLRIRSVEIPVPNIMDILRRNEPPKPISLRLERIRSESDDELMKWLTTESEHPGRPLDEGTKMAITAELMRRHTKPHTPSFVLLVASVVLALASLGYSIWQGQQAKSSPQDSATAPQTTQPAASAAR